VIGCEGPPNVERAGCKVHVRPTQREHLAAAEFETVVDDPRDAVRLVRPFVVSGPRL
jgi:hypothetical protein